MDQSREKLQNRIAQIKDRPLQELLRDLTDSAWSWRQGDQAAVTTDRWITVGGQTVRGTTAQEKAPETVGGQTDGQGQTIPAKDGKDGKDGRDGIDGKDGIPGPAGVDGAPGPAGPAGPTINHDLLPGLNAGDYQHLSVAQKTDLTDGGDSALHYHATDRARSSHTGTQLASTISDFSPAADARIAAQKGVANGIAPLGSDTRIPLSYLPATTIVETSVVASQAAMLALTAQQGDVAVRTDLSKTFILKTEPASTLANWQELLSPTDAVVSVFGRTGPVTAQVGDYSAFYQPLDADLTAIAALATTSYGRSFLTLDDASAALTLIGAQPAGSYQPLDSDLTAIAALGTQAFGRSLLTAVDAAAGRSLLGAQAAGSYEPSIAAGSTAQYWRGDKTWQTMNAAAVGLSNVLNVAQEPALGNPGTSGFLLSSTMAGVRSWVAPYSHPATHPQSVVDAASGWITTALAGKQPSGSYALASNLANYLPLAGGALNNGANITSIRGLYFDQYPDFGQAHIIKGNGDGATQATQTLKICSWYGIGFDDLTTGTTRTWFNVRTGNNYTTGNWYAATDKLVWHSGNFTGTQNGHNHAGVYQPLDSDLTSIAALATTSYGRSFLTLDDAAAALTLIGAQPAGSYVTTDTAQTISAAKTFSAKQIFNFGASVSAAGRTLDIIPSSPNNVIFKDSVYATVIMGIDALNASVYINKLSAAYVNSNLIPYGTGAYDLGDTSFWWKSLYVSYINSTETKADRVIANSFQFIYREYTGSGSNQINLQPSYFEFNSPDGSDTVGVMPSSATAGTVMIIKGKAYGAPRITDIVDYVRSIKAINGSTLATANARLSIVGIMKFVKTVAGNWQEF